jgi:hypothetical protein
VWGFLGAAANAGVVIRTFGGIAIGAGVFFTAAWLLRSEELHNVLGMALRRLRLRTAQPETRDA